MAFFRCLSLYSLLSLLCSSISSAAHLLQSFQSITFKHIYPNKHSCKMLFTVSIILLLPFLSVALPSRTLHAPRAVASLNQAAFEEAQQRDDTATRLFSGTTIKTTTGQCLSVDELSGDFRANLTPVLSAPCNGTDGQKWDVITAGKHIDAPNAMLVVSSVVRIVISSLPPLLLTQ